MDKTEVLNRLKSAVEAETPEIFDVILLIIRNREEASKTKRDHLHHIRGKKYKEFHD